MRAIKRFFSALGLALLVVIAASGAAAMETANSAAGVERVPVTCYAFWSDDASSLLDVGILNPDYPPWLDLFPPVRTVTVQADGVAVFTPSGQVNVVCHDNPSIVYAPDGSPLRSSTFSAHGPAFTAREDAPFQNVRLYGGNANVVVNRGDFQISAHMRLSLST